VLDGRIKYHIAGEVFEGGPGSFFHVPDGTFENFEAVEPTRLLVIYTPGGVEGFFAETGEPAARRELPPAPTEPPDFERIAAISEKYGVTVEAPG
jgi:hypothetical protein